jgi:hypothetical protein
MGVTRDFGRWPEAQSDLWLGRGLPTRHHQRGFSTSSLFTIPFSLANAEVRLRNPRQVLGEFDANQGDRCMEHGTNAPVRLAERLLPLRPRWLTRFGPRRLQLG